MSYTLLIDDMIENILEIIKQVVSKLVNIIDKKILHLGPFTNKPSIK